MRETLRSFIRPPIAGDGAESRAKLVWVVRLRWVAIGAQLLAMLPAIEFQILEPSMLPHFLGIVAGLVALNLATLFALRRGIAATQGRVIFQLCADIAALSGLLALTGGAWNPLVPILFVHAGLGALLLEGHGSLLFFSLLIGCLVVLQLAAHIPPGLEQALVPAEVLFPAQLVVALVFWILTAWLSRTLADLQEHFSTLRERRGRIDRLRAVGALAAGLSHELATPLNTAQLKLERLARKQRLGDNEDLQTAAEALDRCEQVLRTMAGSQLRPEALDFVEVDLGALVEDLCKSLERSDDGGSVRLRVAGRGERSWRAVVPPVALCHALLNLIDNAARSGSQEVEVVLGGSAGQVDISVLDRGPGWPDVVRRHLGEPFVTTRPDGVGLGLYYVHTLAEAVGGALALEDRADGGAIARLSLPAAGERPAAEDVRDE
jgi:two-component system sensor histidine kinase RegB